MYARCDVCNGGGDPLIHRPDCSIGRTQRKAVAMRSLGNQVAGLKAAEHKVVVARGLVEHAIKVAADEGAAKTRIAEVAGISRVRVHQILNGD